MVKLLPIVEAISTPTLETLADEISRYLEEHESDRDVQLFAKAVKAELGRREGLE